MAKVKWADGIEYVSGLVTKRPKAGSMHSDHSTVLLAMRTTQHSQERNAYANTRTTKRGEKRSLRRSLFFVQLLRMSEKSCNFAAQNEFHVK